MKPNDLLERTFIFGVNCLKFLRKLPNDSESKLIRFQLGNPAHLLVQIMKNHKQVHQRQTLKIK